MHSYTKSQRQKAVALARFLSKRYPDVRHQAESLFRILIRTIISQQNRDEMTDISFKKLFSRFKTPEDFADADVRSIASLIKPSGLYAQKARAIKDTCIQLISSFDGKVPKTREELMSLKGVGGKTADIVMAYGYGQDVIACDTHVIWVANALGIVNSAKPEEVRSALMDIVPKKERRMLNIRTVEFGKNICIKSRPKCNLCSLRRVCDYYKNVVLPSGRLSNVLSDKDY